MSQHSQQMVREQAIQLFMRGAPTLDIVIHAMQKLEHDRDAQWRTRMQEEFCENRGTAMCSDREKLWWQEDVSKHGDSGLVGPDNPTFPKTCSSCLTVRGTSP